MYYRVVPKPLPSTGLPCNADIVIIAEFVTNGTGPLSQVSCAFDIGDSNGDSIVDVLDVVNFIECLLSGGVC